MKRWSVREREDAEAWRWAVFARSNGRSVLSGEPGEVAHHVLLQQTLRRRARDLTVDPAWLVWDARNGVVLTWREHERHHSGHAPLPRSCLPVCVFEFADDYGLGWWLDKHYPEQVAA